MIYYYSFGMHKTRYRKPSNPSESSPEFHDGSGTNASLLRSKDAARSHFISEYFGVNPPQTC